MNYNEAIKNGLSFSSLREYNKGLEAFFAYRKGQKAQTDAMRKGNVLDSYLLTPKQFNKDYVVILEDMNKNKKEWKEIVSKADKEGVIPLQKKEFEAIQADKERIMANPECAELLNNCLDAQYALKWQHNDLPFIGKTDMISKIENEMVSGQVIVDLKRTAKPSFAEFVKYANYEILDVQGAMYQYGFEQMHGRRLPFAWLVVGSNYYGVIYMREEEMAAGRNQYFNIVERFKEDLTNCNIDNEFIPFERRTFRRPQWRINQEVK